ncbi:lipase [Pseudonocardiaceae bacterium YIM PH 21723]|nr:lipase [Pseudonocardiaceae bacterium YIM PH 21723]
MRHRGPAAALTAVLVAALLTSGAAQAQDDGFYTPPSPLPAGRGGDVIRHEKMDFYLDKDKKEKVPGSAQRVMYRSSDAHGQPVAVTGVVLTPSRPWTGPGERPLVAWASGTQGLADQCAPSRKANDGTDLEAKNIAKLMERGYGVALTDYQGLGTPGNHTYVIRAAEGHAVLDSARAAQRLREAGLPEHGPVAIAGYSQGGGASAAAAELAGEYAADLDIKGAYAGAPPADLDAAARHLDGTYAMALVGYAIVGLEAADPRVNLQPALNEKGKKFFAEIVRQCAKDSIRKYAFQRSKNYTIDGRPVADYMTEEPWLSVLNDQRLGNRRPPVPTLVMHSRLDDMVAYQQGRQMARDWCALGATVQFRTMITPTHVLGKKAATPYAFDWLQDRFEGKPPRSNCGDF